jgi:predicted TIM-barrel fold metal-dependent hydrolase
MLEALREGVGAYRGVAVVDETTTEATLESLHAAGVRGVRVNVVDVKEGRGAMPLERIRELARRISPLGWHLELLAHVDEHPGLAGMLSDFPVDVVFGHLGYMRTDRGLAAPGFRSLLALLSSGRGWVKLTGPYRISAGTMPYADVAPFADALLEAAPDRVVWGTDWPHVMMKGPMPNDGELANLLLDWIPDEGLRKRVLVDNPARLYGF